MTESAQAIQPDDEITTLRKRVAELEEELADAERDVAQTEDKLSDLAIERDDLLVQVEDLTGALAVLNAVDRVEATWAIEVLTAARDAESMPYRARALEMVIAILESVE